MRQAEGQAREAVAVMLGGRVLGLHRVRQRHEDRLGVLEPIEGGLGAQGGPDPGQQLPVVEGLGEEVRGAGVEAADPIRRRPEAGDQDDRDDRCRRAGAQAAGHLEPVEPRHLDIEQQQIGRSGLRRAQGRAPVGRLDHAVPGAFEEHAQQAAVGRVVLGNDDRRRSDGCSGGTRIGQSIDRAAALARQGSHGSRRI